MFDKILIANRGEIAVRIIRACRELEIKTVAIYSEADREALHVQLADEAICIGPGQIKQSYLNMEAILSAAVLTKAKAIHPGVGFLSENSRFARMCETCGIEFIGPKREIIEAMGDKSNARETAIKAGIPVVVGSNEPIKTVEEANNLGAVIGYPVIIKASAGGGGKGMRIVRSQDEMQSQLEEAKVEAENAFGNGTLYMEKYIENPRHIEVQVLGDKYGNIIHLYERDCSIQRKHQKVIEEGPSSSISEELRTKLGECAVKIANSLGYYSVGTIEFLVDQENKFYFIEMNTRIQVEHPVTEWITGIDLVKEQICVAAGERLSISQKDICHSGYSIECRINAEDVSHSFRPCPGKIQKLRLPGGNGVRVDTAVYQGYVIPSFYDSLIAKIIVRGNSRLEAIRKMQEALEELTIEGIMTNKEFLQSIIRHPKYIEGNYNTGFILREFEL